MSPFVATLGLPQFNPINEQLRLRMDDMFGAGYDYTYLYPGMQEVVQAAGRVIRTEADQGTIWLIDQRFAKAEVKNLLPGWWELGSHPFFNEEAGIRDDKGAMRSGPVLS